jgi:hypothetical protein
VAAGVAAVALGVLLRREESRLVLAVLEPDAPIADRLRRLGAADDPPHGGWLRDLVEDRDSRWRSPWLRACAIHAAIATGQLAGMDLGNASRLGDPVIDELLAYSGSGRIISPVGDLPLGQ